MALSIAAVIYEPIDFRIGYGDLDRQELVAHIRRASETLSDIISYAEEISYDDDERLWLYDLDYDFGDGKHSFRIQYEPTDCVTLGPGTDTVAGYLGEYEYNYGNYAHMVLSVFNNASGFMTPLVYAIKEEEGNGWGDGSPDIPLLLDAVQDAVDEFLRRIG